MHAWSAATMRLRRGLALGVIGLGASIAPLDFSVNIVFPAMAQAFGIQPTDIRWVAISLVLTYGSLMLAFGALGDRIGHLRVFRAGLALAIVAFSVCTWAPDFSVMLVGRVLQGISVALVLSCAPALATRAFPEHSRTFALAAYGSLMAAAGILAPLIGSLSLLTVGWPGVFAVRIPLMALALVASSPRLRLLSVDAAEASPGPCPSHPTRAAASPGPGEGHSVRTGYEPVTATSIVPDALPRSHPAWLALGLALLLMVPPLLGELGGAASARVTGGVILCGVGGAWILTRFIRSQHTLSRPFLPGAIATRRTFWRLQAAAVLIQFSSFALPLIAPFALLGALGQGALSSGALMSVWAVGTLAGSALMPRIIRAMGVARATQASLWLASLGLFMVALWGQLPGLPWAVASLLVQGAALGLFQVGYGDQVIAALPAQARGVAGSLTMVTRTIGLVLGASLWIALLRAGGFMAVYLVAAGVLIVFGSLTRGREDWSITS